MLKLVKHFRKTAEYEIKKLDDHMVWDKTLQDLCDACVNDLRGYESPNDLAYVLDTTHFLKVECVRKLQAYSDPKYLEIYFTALLAETPYLFESFIEFLERKRDNSKKFYAPRKKILHPIALDLQWLEDDPNAKFYGLSLPARTGKSTIAILFICWVMYKRPNSHNAMGGHSGILAKGFYKEVLNFIGTDEYCFAEMWNYLHPNCTLLRDKSAEEFTITLDKPDRFATLTCRGCDATWTGAVDVSGYGNVGYLYVDDLVRDREQSLSPIRMENTYQQYLNVMVDRKNDGAKELMIGTLWNVYDPLERLYKEHNGEEGWRFRRIPALDENDESNFKYEINGFSTEYYREMREKLNDAEWQAKYQQRPYVREGLLFQSDELRYFNGILPEGDHRIVAVVDVAWGGGDSLSMPIGAEYENGDVYIFAWVFNKGTKETTIPLVTARIMSHEIREIRFEGNTGGDLYAQYVDENLKANHYKCSISSRKAPSTMAKVQKIIAYSDDIKRKFVFLSDVRPTKEQLMEDARIGITRYVRDEEYQSAMDELCMFVTIGKNEHDDAPDGLTQLEMFIEGGMLAKIEIPTNPFRGIA